MYVYIYVHMLGDRAGTDTKLIHQIDFWSFIFICFVERAGGNTSGRAGECSGGRTGKGANNEGKGGWKKREIGGRTDGRAGGRT